MQKDMLTGSCLSFCAVPDGIITNCAFIVPARTPFPSLRDLASTPIVVAERTVHLLKALL